MKRFSLQEYLANPSQNVVTRNGKPVRILCTDAKGDYPVVGLVYCTDGDERESPESFTENGSYDISNEENYRDLFFAPKQGEGWVNLYKHEDGLIAGYVFATKEQAEVYYRKEPRPNYVTTTKINWEE